METLIRTLKWGAVCVGLILAVIVIRFVAGRPAFDARKLGSAETRMWQAYYTSDKMKLGLELMDLLRCQHGLSLMEAKQVAESFARSAMQFRSAGGDCDTCLQELTSAYAVIQHAGKRHFDPARVARAELAWWVARRTPGQDSAEQVGERIAELYALLYEKPVEQFRAAAFLRAKAAKLRDAGGQAADWGEVESMLQASYRQLRAVL